MSINDKYEAINGFTAVLRKLGMITISEQSIYAFILKNKVYMKSEHG